jgi:DNA replication protein DnaC
VLLFIGPIECGKTGLAASYLIHASHNEYRVRFIDFKELLSQSYASITDSSEKKAL